MRENCSVRSGEHRKLGAELDLIGLHTVTTQIGGKGRGAPRPEQDSGGEKRKRNSPVAAGVDLLLRRCVLQELS